MAHLYWTEVYRALGTPGNAWALFYERGAEWNTPNLAHFAVQYLLASAFEPHVAQRLGISLLIVAWIAAVQFLSRQLRGELTLGAFASLLLIHSSWLYGGYLPFLTGVPILLLTFALLVGLVQSHDQSGTSPLTYVAISLLGIGTYYTHFVAATVFLATLCLAIAFSRRRRPVALALVLAAIPTGLLVLSYLFASRFGDGGVRWEPLSKSLARFVGLAFFRGFAVNGPAFWLALAVLGVLFALLVARAARVGRFLLATTIILVVLYWVAPDAVGKGYNLKGRYQLVMWAFLLPSLPYGMGRNTRSVVLAGVALLLSWQIVEFSLRARRFNERYENVLEQAKQLPPGSTLSAAVDYDTAGFEDSFIRVLAHAPEDVAYHSGGVLLRGYHPSTEFYWVRVRGEPPQDAAYHIAVAHGPDEALSLVITKPGS